MIEYKAQTGGRYCYNEDILNLQDLALAYSSIFEEYDNFIVSGCQVVDNTITPGMVWLNGKLRRFGGATEVSRFPQYICESNTTESVEYANNTTQLGRETYGCRLSSIAPTDPDSITGLVPEYIMITETGGPDMRKVFFGKHCILLQDENSQEINSSLVFKKEIVSQASLVLKNTNALQIQGLNSYMNFVSENDGTLIRSGINGDFWDIKFADVFGLYKNKTEVFSCSDNEFKIAANSVSFGSLVFEGGNIYNPGTSLRDSVNINFTSPNNAYYKNTYIGDGKGKALLSVVGANSAVYINGNLIVEGKLSLPQTIEWREDAHIRLMGLDIEIANLTGNLIIDTKEAVIFRSSISEKGMLLADKYAAKAGGLRQFITDNTSAAILRDEIGALSKEEMDQSYPKLKALLSDMADSEENKKAIRTNIGAQEKIQDTGWIRITGADPNSNVYARQYGKFVYVQGQIAPCATGKVWFTLPGRIDPPTQTIAYTHCGLSDTMGGLVAQIYSNARNVYMTYSHKEIRQYAIDVQFSYMVD